MDAPPPPPFTLDAGVLAPDSGVPSAPSADPFAALPDTSEGLVNVSSDLRALLENGELPGACAAYEADPGDRRKMLLCGKYMFFYEGFGTIGIPKALMEFFVQNFPEEVGPGFEKHGMIPDPYSSEAHPIGVGVGAPLENVETLAFTCASCHFGRLPDGRYAVGQGNHDYDYGTQFLTLLLAPSLISPLADESAHDPDAVARVRPVLDKLQNDRPLRIRLLLQLLPLISVATDAMPQLTPEIEAQYASWPTGTMDFAIVPLPLEDGVHTVSKISSLFGIPRPEERQRVGMQSAMLAWTGAASSLMSFVEGFVLVGGGTDHAWTQERLRPLVEYLYTLRPPAPPAPVRGERYARGARLFRDKGCIDCHAGPRGSGIRLYDYDEIGTDRAMQDWGRDLTLPGGDPLTGALKSPRLSGLWAMRRFLHNGSVRSLEALFCLDGPRGAVTEAPFGDGGHEFTCVDLTSEEKRTLIDYLESH